MIDLLFLVQIIPLANVIASLVLSGSEGASEAISCYAGIASTEERRLAMTFIFHPSSLRQAQGKPLY